MSARHSVEYAALMGATRLINALPVDAVRRVAASLARRYFDLGGRRVGYALTNLRIAFPDLSEQERREIGRQSYVYTAWNLIDWLRSTRWSEKDIDQRFEVSGLEHVKGALALGRGAVALTGHIGSFEGVIKAAPLWGIPVSAVGRPMANRRLYERVVYERTRTGARAIDRRRAAPQILRALRNGDLVAMLVDQYSRRSHGVFVPLFGARCSTTAGPATLAARTGAPILPFYTVRVAPDHHRAYFLPPLELEVTGDRKRDVELATARVNGVLEQIIRKHPEQWMWAHRRFRHSPDLPDLKYD